MTQTLQEVLTRHLEARQMSYERLADAAHLKDKTVYWWFTGKTRRPQRWQDLAKAARALGLDRAETDELLASAGKPTLDVLESLALDAEDRALIHIWQKPTPFLNLPHRLTQFIGRGDELGELHEVLAGNTRLVTLIGPGGSGKTRLALAAAFAAQALFPEAHFVDLAAVRDADQVLPAIARALGVAERSGESVMVTLRDYLRNRHLLLVLDNFEQVVAAGPEVKRLLVAAPKVAALVTSRVRLRLLGEYVYPVLPLPLPSLADPFATISANPAVALFADRASAVERAFHLTAANAPLVAELCIKLDGLPLAIELAAVRIDTMSLPAMVAGLTSRLALASDGPQDLDRRQQTIQATIAWSVELLELALRPLFQLCGAFANGFFADDVAAVWTTVAQDPIDVAKGLRVLLDHQLLVRADSIDGEPQYGMLETIREYARDVLTTQGSLAAVQEQHAAYYRSFAERAETEMPYQSEWHDRLRHRRENLWAALRWYRDRGDDANALRLLLAMASFWSEEPATTWLEWFTALTQDPSRVPPSLRARAYFSRGFFLLRLEGDSTTTERLFTEALEIFRAEGDVAGEADAGQALGSVLRFRGEWRRARDLYTQSIALATSINHARLLTDGYIGLALTVQNLTPIADYMAEAERYWRLGLDWAIADKHRPNIVLATNSLGEMARYRRDWRAAEEFYMQALTLATELGSRYTIAMTTHNLAYIAHYHGDSKLARERFCESLRWYQQWQDTKGQAECFAGLAMVDAAEGHDRRAAMLCGACAGTLHALGLMLDTLDREEFERTLATVHDRLGDWFEPAFAEGRAMSLDDARAFALGDS